MVNNLQQFKRIVINSTVIRLDGILEGFFKKCDVYNDDTIEAERIIDSQGTTECFSGKEEAFISFIERTNLSLEKSGIVPAINDIKWL